MQADVVFLQEVQGRHDQHAARHAAHWPDEAQHQFLAGDSHHHHSVYGMNAVYDHGHHGNALLSCFPIMDSSNQDVSDHAFERRGLLHCLIQTPKTNIHCYVVHLGLFGGSRKRQTEALIQAVGQAVPDDVPLIIAGDFNDWTDHLSDTLRSRLRVMEVFDEQSASTTVTNNLLLHRFAGNLIRRKPARTFPAGLPWLRLDRIYVRGFKIESAEVLRGTPWSKLSDHAPIVTTLQLQ
jgi:endonuclease/exonuclease/phosphatase family metal-dependent hydrolase